VGAINGVRWIDGYRRPWLRAVNAAATDLTPQDEVIADLCRPCDCADLASESADWQRDRRRQVGTIATRRRLSTGCRSRVAGWTWIGAAEHGVGRNLSASAVKRRIGRLERIGVITGYTALIDHSRLGVSLEAFTELRFAGNTNVESITRAATRLPEVIEVFTVAGDPDALVRLRVTSVKHLQAVVDNLRRDDSVIGTKTLMVLDSWRKSAPDR